LFITIFSIRANQSSTISATMVRILIVLIGLLVHLEKPFG
jgi:hypothetical protein